MCALFGLGRHPNDRAIIRQLARDGASRRVQDAATKLGHAYHLYEPSAFHAALAARYREFNTDRGARGDAAIPDAVRARIRSELGREWFRTEHHRDPLDAREFTGYLARISRPAPMPVAGYDLTFSPVKSVSALWAIAPRELAATIAACHDEAVRDTIGWLEKHAAYTRRGTNGVAQVDTTGLIAAAFTHRDSRAGDPDLHTHVAVSNKVCTPDGRWLSLDGRALYRNKVAASEHYNTRLEALLIERVGVRFADRGDAADGRREVREIAGLPPELLRAWSSRTADIEAELAVLARRFQDEHGRPPTTIERAELAQQATLSTRDPKHEPRSEAEQRRTWQSRSRRSPPWRGPGRSPRTAGHRPHDGSGRRRRGPARRDSDRNGAGVPGDVAGAPRPRRGRARVSLPCRRARLSRRSGNGTRTVARLLGTAHRPAEHRRAEPAAPSRRLLGVRGSWFPPLHLHRRPER